MPDIVITIDDKTMLVEKVVHGGITRVIKERPADDDTRVNDQIDLPKKGKPVLREKQLTVLHSNPTYIVIGGVIYCWG